MKDSIAWSKMDMMFVEGNMLSCEIECVRL